MGVPDRTRSMLLRLLAMTGLLVTAGGTTCDGEPGPLPAGPPCECYLSSDCPGACHWASHGAECTPTGKNDGTCEGMTVPGGTPGSPGMTEPPAMKAALNLGFDAYIPAIVAGGGVADAESWAAMADTIDDPEVLYGVRLLVHQSLDITLGWDINPTEWGNPMSPGNVRLAEKPGVSLAMLEATRQGVLAAVDTGNPNMVSPPIVQFWNNHPKFEPGHLGRCYPHGHAEIEYAKPIQCQLDELIAMLEVALGSAGLQ